MGYVGGYGAGRGWHKLFLLVTPDELSTILNSSDGILIANGRVPTSYRLTSSDEYIQAYKRYYHAMLGGEDLTDWRITQPLSSGMTRSMSIVMFEPIAHAPEYKCVKLSEPIVGLRPYPLVYLDGKISLAYGGYNEFSFGLELIFPKVVSFSREGHEWLYETSQFENYSLFIALRESVLQSTERCKINTPSGLRRPDVRISAAVKIEINRHPGLRQQGLQVV